MVKLRKKIIKDHNAGGKKKNAKYIKNAKGELALVMSPSSATPSKQPLELEHVQKPRYAKGLHPNLVKHQFQKGQASPNPGGKPKYGGPRMGSRNMMTRLWAAMDQIEQETGKDYVQELLRSAMKSDTVRNNLLNKLLPSKLEDVLTTEDVKQVVGKVVAIVRKFVLDKAVFTQIATEVAKIQLMPGQGRRVGASTAQAPKKKVK